MIGIYKITSPSGKIYIGQSIDIKKRLRDYKNNKGVKQPKLNNSFLKYGFDAHEIEVICECLIEELNDKERYYQDLFDCVKKGLNCTLTASNDKSGKLSLETRKKISISNSNQSQEIRDSRAMKLKGRKRPDEVRFKISESSKGKKVSEATKIRLAEISRNMSPETRLKKSISATAKVQSKETRKKISAGLIGRNRSDETKLKISEKHGTRVIDIVTGQEFLSVAKAAKYLGCNISNLHNKLKGIRRNNTNLKFA